MSSDYSLHGLVWLASLLAAFLTIILALYSLCPHLIRQMVLWRIPGPPCQSFLTGNFLQMFDAVSGFEFRKHVWKNYGTVSRFHGPLWDQILLISDPVALTSILIKQQETFEQHEWFTELFRHAVGPGLLSSTGALHRRQRKLLNPIFSPSRIRSMVPLLHKITDQVNRVFRDALRSQITDGPMELDIVEWFGRLVLEMIAQGGLGHSFDDFTYGADKNEFNIAIKEFMLVMSRLNLFLPIFLLVTHWPSKLLRSIAVCLPWADLHHFLGIVDTMDRCTVRLFQSKKALLAQGDAELTQLVSGGQDIISVLMTTDTDAGETEMQDDEIMAQMLTLLAAATETTSNSIARLVHVLSQHQDAQDELRREVNAAVAVSGGELGYEQLTELPYLDAICRETLRLYPPASFVSRICRADTTIPLSHPIPIDYTPHSSLFVPRGTTIILDILGINCSQDIWGADADSWRPERWLSPLPESVAGARIPGVYSNMLTFLGGPRSCIGFKLSELEMKVVLSQLIRSFRFLPSKTEIVWRLGPVTTPSVKGSLATSSLPVVLERI
ncbi:cytochrome P450 [Artomyces pyxidatus]|uniref:Cytochrome P450 n=1 Tax=Artomyces pyxidatus TaxID=48021 RepID=A0ACB8SKB5_9AGAM|nr:cytochrome P450 [Artomyces pyxidatus]